MRCFRRRFNYAGLDVAGDVQPFANLGVREVALKPIAFCNQQRYIPPVVTINEIVNNQINEWHVTC